MPLFLFAVRGKILFAYAKPVPYNPYNLKDQRWGPVAVALAGHSPIFAGVCFWRHCAGVARKFTLTVFVLDCLCQRHLGRIQSRANSTARRLQSALRTVTKRLWQRTALAGSVWVLRPAYFCFFLFNLLQPVIDFVFRLATGGVGVF